MFVPCFLSKIHTMFSKVLGLKSASTQAQVVPESSFEGPVYLISMAGFPNYGDELIAARWLHFLAEHHPDVDVWLDVREPGTVASLLKGIHPRLHITNTLFRAIHEHVHGLNRTPAELVRDLGSPKFDVGLLELREATTIHLLRGGFVNAIWQENTLLVDAMRAAREISGARLLATGQGLMPRVPEDFHDFEYVSVRDQASADSLGIARGYDDAYLVTGVPTFSEQSYTPEESELYICIQNDALDENAHTQLISYAKAQIEKLGIPREKTFYVEAIPGDDYAGYASLREYISEDNGFIPFAHFWRSGFRFAPHQVWLTTRFHHHLVGSMHGARGIALSGKVGYYDVKHGSLADTGTRWKVPTDLTRTYSFDDLESPLPSAQQIQIKNKEAQQLYTAK